AAAVGRDPLLFAIGVELTLALHTQLGLQRAWRVVDARVEHPAVVARLVLADRGVLVEDRKAQFRIPAEKLAADRQAQDACANDDDVVATHVTTLRVYLQSRDGLRGFTRALRDLAPGSRRIDGGSRGINTRVPRHRRGHDGLRGWSAGRGGVSARSARARVFESHPRGWAGRPALWFLARLARAARDCRATSRTPRHRRHYRRQRRHPDRVATGAAPR